MMEPSPVLTPADASTTLYTHVYALLRSFTREISYQIVLTGSYTLMIRKGTGRANGLFPSPDGSGDGSGGWHRRRRGYSILTAA